MPYGDSATQMSRRIVDQPFRDRPFMMPDHTTSAGVECKSIVGRGHEHDPVHNDGCHFKTVRIIRMKYPLRSQLSDIAAIDLRQTAVSSSREVPVVGKPIGTGWLSGQLGSMHINDG